MIRWLLFGAACLVLGTAVTLLCLFIKMHDKVEAAIVSPIIKVAANLDVAPTELPNASGLAQTSLSKIYDYGSSPTFIQDMSTGALADNPNGNGLPMTYFQEQSASLAVSFDGTTIAIGAPSMNTDVGAVYIYVKTANGWQNQAVLIGQDGSQGNRCFFGNAVALSADGNVCACGAPLIGTVWIFTRSGTTWTTQTTETGPDGPTGFGGTVALSYDGCRLAVGGGNIVTVYSQSGSGWVEETTFSPESGLSFASSLGMSGDGRIVTTCGDAIWVFQNTSGQSWSTTRLLKDDYVKFITISGDGNTIACTQIIRNGNSFVGQGFITEWMVVGRTYVFVNIGQNNWRQLSRITPETAPYGASVRLNHSGELLFVGDSYNGQGFVHVYSNLTNKYYDLVKTITCGNPHASTDHVSFGTAIAIDSWGKTLVIGAPFSTDINGNGSGGLNGIASIYE